MALCNLDGCSEEATTVVVEANGPATDGGLKSPAVSTATATARRA